MNMGHLGFFTVKKRKLNFLLQKTEFLVQKVIKYQSQQRQNTGSLLKENSHMSLDPNKLTCGDVCREDGASTEGRFVTLCKDWCRFFSEILTYLFLPALM